MLSAIPYYSFLRLQKNVTSSRSSLTIYTIHDRVVLIVKEGENCFSTYGAEALIMH